ncbi:MAG: L-histidine N(alpha)-methyltransferase [Candidatus Competibacteraceae bacterium]
MSINIAESYDHYFASRLYDQRYPRANPSCLALIMDEIRQQGTRVLDFGCGNGRYTAPLLQHTEATLVAYDISPEAIRTLSQQQAPHLASGRLQPIIGDLTALREMTESSERFALILMMFGVLGHIFPQMLRQETLATVRNLLQPGGRLIITVPNARRRFLKEQTAARQRGLEPGDILYRRRTPDQTINMYYHLYTLMEFQQELEQAGFRLVRLRAESVLPESGVVRSATLGWLDRMLIATMPLRYAYGFLAVVQR